MKRKKEMQVLPKIVSGLQPNQLMEVASGESITTTGPIEPTGEVVSISVPLFHWTAGNAHRKVTALRLTRQQAATLKSLTMGLENQEAQLKDGRFVSRPVDAIRWMLEQLQQS